MQLSCATEKAISQCVIEANVDNLMSYFVLIDGGGTQPVMAFIHCRDHYIVLKRNQLVGTTTEIQQVVPELNIKKIEVCQFTNLNGIPSHLQDLYKRSSTININNSTRKSQRFVVSIFKCISQP